jgi:post-segregation antitoxin (ccd killing protein)
MSKSMTMSPRDVSNKTLMAYQVCAIEFRVSAAITARIKKSSVKKGAAKWRDENVEPTTAE